MLNYFNTKNNDLSTLVWVDFKDQW